MEQSQQLARYLQRIGVSSAPSADAAGLGTILQGHRHTFAFENLDIFLGRPISIDSDSVFDKLVQRGRGGYCFEQNRLLSDMLSVIGFANRPLLARVRLGTQPEFTPPRTHLLLAVELDGGLWAVDGGFGGSYVPPMPLQDGATAQSADGAQHRLRKTGRRGELSGEWQLERAGPSGATDGRAANHGDWQPQYSFDLAEVASEDLEQANHWTSTRPDTRFTNLHVVSLPLPDGFAAMSDRRLSVWRDGVSQVREISDAADYGTVLREAFGLALTEKEISELPLFA